MAIRTHGPGRISTCATSTRRVRLSIRSGPFVPSSFRVSGDRKSTRLNSSHSQISYAVFCLKKKNSDDVHTESEQDPHNLDDTISEAYHNHTLYKCTQLLPQKIPEHSKPLQDQDNRQHH